MNVNNWQSRLATSLERFSPPLLLPLVVIYIFLTFTNLASNHSVVLVIKAWMLINLVVRAKQLMTGPGNYLSRAILVTALLLWLPSLFLPDDHRQVENLWALTLISCSLPLIESQRFPWLKLKNAIGQIIPVLLATIPFVHLIAAMTTSSHSGNFDNPHYLAMTMILSVPMLLYWLKNHTRSHWQQILLIMALLSSVYLLLLTHSRPAWLALLAASVICMPVVGAKHRLLIGGLLILAPFVFYLTNILGFADRINDLVFNITTEERVGIWQDSWTMQLTSTCGEWLFGHGLGMFRDGFTAFSRSHGTVDFYSPHNYLLEVLYNSGIYGVLIMTFLFCLILVQLFHFSRYSEPFVRRIGQLLLMMFTGHFLLTFLTLPIFAPKTVYFLALILGLQSWLTKTVAFRHSGSHNIKYRQTTR